MENTQQEFASYEEWQEAYLQWRSKRPVMKDLEFLEYNAMMISKGNKNWQCVAHFELSDLEPDNFKFATVSMIEDYKEKVRKTYEENLETI